MYLGYLRRETWLHFWLATLCLRVEPVWIQGHLAGLRTLTLCSWIEVCVSDRLFIPGHIVLSFDPHSPVLMCYLTADSHRAFLPWSRASKTESTLALLCHPFSRDGKVMNTQDFTLSIQLRTRDTWVFTPIMQNTHSLNVSELIEFSVVFPALWVKSLGYLGVFHSYIARHHVQITFSNYEYGKSLNLYFFNYVF